MVDRTEWKAIFMHIVKTFVMKHVATVFQYHKHLMIL